MQSKMWGLVFFALGVFFLFLYTTASFLWNLIGVPLPYLPIPSSIWGFLPPIGAALVVTGGLVYGRKPKEAVK